MSFDAFLYFPGGDHNVKGETQDDEMSKKGAFEIKEFGFGARNNINIGSISSGGGAGKAEFEDFTISKQTDTGSCGLFKQLCMGTHFPEAVIELRRSGGASGAAGGSGATFMKFHFLLVMVGSINWSGSDGDDICTEEVVFQYGAMKIEYFQQMKDGKMVKAPPGQGEAIWSRVKNKAVYAV